MIQYESIQKALGAEIAISPKMSEAISLWNKLYVNEAPWLNEEIRSLNLPAGICQEMARLVTMEAKITIDGSERADLIADSMRKFFMRLPHYVEYACATGGIVFKPYVTRGKIAIDIAKCGNYYPTNFDSAGNVTGMIFPEFKMDGKKLFIRLEWQRLEGDIYIIDNKAYVSEKALVLNNGIVNLGQEIPLDSVPEWEGMEPHAELGNVEQPLFFLFGIPLANNIDPESPLGVSIYSRAVEQIRDADQQYGATLWEFNSKETAIQASSEFFDKNNRGDVVLPKGKERLYHAMGDGMMDEFTGKPLFNSYSPDIRDQSFFNGYNKIVQKVEFNSNIAYGTLSDPQVVEKTAEEIKTSKQRSYSTVKAIQNSLQDAIDGVIGAIDVWVDIEDLAPPGKIETGYDWDDSLVVDKKSEIAELRADVSMGAVGLVEYRMKRFGETEEQAKEAIAAIVDIESVQE